MNELETYYETQNSNKEKPSYWRSIGEKTKTFVEISKQTRDLADKDRIKKDKSIVHSFRIVESTVTIRREEITKTLIQ